MGIEIKSRALRGLICQVSRMLNLAEVAIFVFPLFGGVEIDVDVRAISGLRLVKL